MRPEPSAHPRDNTLATEVASPRGRYRAFTIVELLIVIAVLIIVLGMMTNLARSVRVGYATDVTKDLLRQLDIAVTQYRERFDRVPDVTPLVPNEGSYDDTILRKNALLNNRQIVATLASGFLPPGVLTEQPITIYNNGQLRDAWGTPIAFLPRFDRQIGMALRDRPFFVSAGPDRKFLTLEDNFYSYEGAAPDEPEPTTAPAINRRTP